MRKYNKEQIEGIKKEMSVQLEKYQIAVKEIEGQRSRDSKLIKVLNESEAQRNGRNLENIVERTVHQVLTEQEKVVTEKIAGKKQIVIYLNQDGDLWREPKNQYCYPLQTKGKRIDLVNLLTKQYKTSEVLSSQTGYVLGSGLFDAIKEINRNVKKHLDVQYPFIESRQGDGYRINPVYKLIKR